MGYHAYGYVDGNPVLYRDSWGYASALPGMPVNPEAPANIRDTLHQLVLEGVLTAAFVATITDLAIDSIVGGSPNEQNCANNGKGGITITKNPPTPATAGGGAGKGGNGGDDDSQKKLTFQRIRDYLKNIKGKTRQDIKKSLEDIGLKLKGKSLDDRFMEFVDKAGNVRAKIHPPDAVTQYNHLHIYNRTGNALDKLLNQVLPKSPAAHIEF